MTSKKSLKIKILKGIDIDRKNNRETFIRARDASCVNATVTHFTEV